jgi:hypothetical protein
MSPEKVLIHIDNTIIERLQKGHRWSDIVEYLDGNINRYKKRDSYIQVSEIYLVRNWDQIEWKKRLTTMLVIQSNRRKKDINWISKNHVNFPRYGSIKMYKMLSLKDKLRSNVV